MRVTNPNNMIYSYNNMGKKESVEMPLVEKLALARENIRRGKEYGNHEHLGRSRPSPGSNLH